MRGMPSFGFRNVPDWDRFYSANFQMWQANNQSLNIYKQDEIVRRINALGHPVTSEEVSKIYSEVYSE